MRTNTVSKSYLQTFLLVGTGGGRNDLDVSGRKKMSPETGDLDFNFLVLPSFSGFHVKHSDNRERMSNLYKKCSGFGLLQIKHISLNAKPGVAELDFLCHRADRA